MRGDQATRQWRLLAILESRPAGSTVQQLGRELGVSIRTVYRDLEVLQAIGVPLTNESEGREVQWKLLEGHLGRRNVPFTLHEAVALDVALRVLTCVGAGCWQNELQSAVSKVCNALSTAQLTRFEQLGSRVEILCGRARPSRVRPEVHAAACRSLLEHRTLEVLYMDGGRAQRRSLEPHTLHIQDSGVFLVGRDPRLGRMCRMPLHRVRSAAVGDAHFLPPEVPAAEHSRRAPRRRLAAAVQRIRG